MNIDIDRYIEESGMSRESALNLIVAEAFMRRAARVDGPFALKGSLVLRQYLPDPSERIPGDIDWIGMEPLDEAALNDWVLRVTAVELDDGVRFRSFAENRFWRMIEYAMNEDFPTVNTDLLAWVNGEAHELCGMDVTFGLKLDPEPIPMSYRSAAGDLLEMPATCPLELQLAWKLHQCLLRPRFKDLVDVLWLLQANGIDATKVTDALHEECVKDSVPLARFDWLLDGTLAQHPAYAQPSMSKIVPIEERYVAWRGGGQWQFEPPAKYTVRHPEGLPDSANELLTQLAAALLEAGFQSLLEPQPAKAETPLPETAQVNAPLPSSSPAPTTVGEYQPGLWATLRRWLK